jgi:hypothetical protein
VPVPALVEDDFEPYPVVVPYSTHQVVAFPPGLTVPVTVADVPPTAVVGPVVTAGAAAAAPATKIVSATAESAPVARQLLPALRPTAPPCQSDAARITTARGGSWDVA